LRRAGAAPLLGVRVPVGGKSGTRRGAPVAADRCSIVRTGHVSPGRPVACAASLRGLPAGVIALRAERVRKARGLYGFGCTCAKGRHCSM